MSYTDRELVEGCRTGSRQWQERLYRRFFPPMLAMVRRYTGDEDAQIAIINDGLLKVFTKLDSYAFRGSFEGWVRRLVYHALSDHFRKENKYLRFLVMEERDAPLRTTALDRLYTKDLLHLIDELPPATREVFHQYAIEGYNHREIGERLGISAGTSKWHLSEARKFLKPRLEQLQLHRHAG